MSSTSTAEPLEIDPGELTPGRAHLDRDLEERTGGGSDAGGIPPPAPPPVDRDRHPAGPGGRDWKRVLLLATMALVCAFIGIQIGHAFYRSGQLEAIEAELARRKR